MAPITLKDVAKEADVSIKTVSRVVNKQGEISDATRQRVLIAIEKLRYRPNKLARGLITGKTNAVGIIVPNISDPFYPDFIQGAENVARSRNFNVILCNSNREPELELEYVELLTDRRIDGMMIAGSRLEIDGLKQATSGQNLVILSPYAIPDAVIFTIDDQDGGYQVGNYLISLGHKRIAFLEGTWSQSAKFRYRGLLNSIEEAGLPSEGCLVGSISPETVDLAYDVALKFLGGNFEFTALFCYNDVLALGVLQACRKLGVRVPEDLSVVGFDDIPEAARACVPLTTYRIDRHQLGARMMDRLLDLIEKKCDPFGQELIPGELIVRDSCAPPRVGPPKPASQTLTIPKERD